MALQLAQDNHTPSAGSRLLRAVFGTELALSLSLNTAFDALFCKSALLSFVCRRTPVRLPALFYVILKG